MNVRLAREQDLPAIVAIYNTAIPSRSATADMEAVSVESRLAWFKQFGEGKRPLWVIETNGEVAGWLGLGHFKERAGYRHTAEVGIYIAPQFIGKGMGKTLLKHALSEAPAWQIKNIMAVIFGHNAGSIAFFMAHGFEKWGHLPCVTLMDGVERDVVIYGINLD